MTRRVQGICRGPGLPAPTSAHLQSQEFQHLWHPLWALVLTSTYPHTGVHIHRIQNKKVNLKEKKLILAHQPRLHSALENKPRPLRRIPLQDTSLGRFCFGGFCFVLFLKVKCKGVGDPGELLQPGSLLPLVSDWLLANAEVVEQYGYGLTGWGFAAWRGHECSYYLREHFSLLFLMAAAFYSYMLITFSTSPPRLQQGSNERKSPLSACLDS